MCVLKFVFWNIGRKPLINELKEILKDKKADILALAEFDGEANELLIALSNDNMNYYLIPQIGCQRITILSKIMPKHFHHRAETEYYTIKEISVPGGYKLLVVFIHFPSKLFMTDDDQMVESQMFKQEIEMAEKQCQNYNTIIIGDFNMNPFEKGMVAASAIHSIPCSLTAKERKRVIKGREYSMFYNPMWNLFGDNDNKPGTYYYKKASHLVYFWNIFDQVIIRPGLIDKFNSKSLEIISKAGEISLVDENHRPCLSDHLPIFFSLKEASEL
jgi:hypothetical protein